MRPTLIALLLLAAACAAPPPAEPVPEPPPASPLARAALEEWRAWGGIVVVGWPAERPPDTAATEARFSRLLDYWAAVPGTGGIRRRLLATRNGVAEAWAASAAVETEAAAEEGGEEAGAALRPVLAATLAEDMVIYNRPAWSAAFISAVARQAGVPGADLPSSPTHARYIDRILARAAEDPEGAPFLPHAPEERAPRPGDLLCTDRSWHKLPHWTARLRERGRPRAMHCDVVVRTAPGFVDVVGGNVEDMVTLRRIPADEEGRVLPAPPGRPVFLLVLAAR